MAMRGGQGMVRGLRREVEAWLEGYEKGSLDMVRELRGEVRAWLEGL